MRSEKLKRKRFRYRIAVLEETACSSGLLGRLSRSAGQITPELAVFSRRVGVAQGKNSQVPRRGSQPEASSARPAEGDHQASTSLADQAPLVATTPGPSGSVTGLQESVSLVSMDMEESGEADRGFVDETSMSGCNSADATSVAAVQLEATIAAVQLGLAAAATQPDVITAAVQHDIGALMEVGVGGVSPEVSIPIVPAPVSPETALTPH